MSGENQRGNTWSKGGSRVKGRARKKALSPLLLRPVRQILKSCCLDDLRDLGSENWCKSRVLSCRNF